MGRTFYWDMQDASGIVDPKTGRLEDSACPLAEDARHPKTDDNAAPAPVHKRFVANAEDFPYMHLIFVRRSSIPA